MAEQCIKDFLMPNIFFNEFFTTVEVEVNTNCNRRCGYCPNGVLEPQSAPQLMTDAVFTQLLSHLQQLNFSGRISYHFYNEPLLRDDLEALINQTRQQIPAAHPVLYTNGDFLSEERYLSLRESGLEFIVISSHGGQEYPQRAGQIVLDPKKLPLSNRGGIIPNIQHAAKQAVNKPCYAPDEMLIITVCGDVLLCYEDASKKYVMGNIMEQSIESIWMSDPFVTLRTLLKKGRREKATDICRVCNNLAHIIPGTSHLP